MNDYSDDSFAAEEWAFDSIAEGDYGKVVYKGEYYPGVVQVKSHDSAKAWQEYINGSGLKTKIPKAILEGYILKISNAVPVEGTVSRPDSLSIFED